MDAQGNFLNIIDSLRHYDKGLLSEEEIHKNLMDFYNDFSNCDFFEFPNGYDEKSTRAILHRLSLKNKNMEFYCLIVIYILEKNFNVAYNMLLL